MTEPQIFLWQRNELEGEDALEAARLEMESAKLTYTCRTCTKVHLVAFCSYSKRINNGMTSVIFSNFEIDDLILNVTSLAEVKRHVEEVIRDHYPNMTALFEEKPEGTLQ